MSASFYRAFEDRYRGSRELITARLRAYDDFIAPLTRLHQPAAALDLGCGRGEWLELLGQAGFAAKGVDLDEGMLAACRERALNVELADALTSLRALPDSSVALVSAFHLVEHIPFDQVQVLIGEALRVLQPGGLLIMETPNPENLVVGASSFYMDPSHLRPVPSPLLDFVVEYSGFARHKVVRLQESAQLHTAAPIGLINVLDGVSPDYAVIGQKSAAPDLLAPWDAPFRADYGVALADLAQRFDRQEEQRRNELHVGLAQLDEHVNGSDARDAQEIDNVRAGLAQLETHTIDSRGRIAEIEGKLAQLAQRADDSRDQAQAADAQLMEHLAWIEQRMRQAERNAAQAKAAAQAELQAAHALAQAELHAAQAQAHAELHAAKAEARAAQAVLQAAQAEARAVQLTQRVADLLESRSWRLTAPLRLTGAYAQRVCSATRQGRLGSGVKRRLNGLLAQLVHSGPRPRCLQRAARILLRRFPGLRARLHLVMQRAAKEPPAAAAAPAPLPGDLSPRTLRMFRELKKSLEARKNN
jgi:SAM-dependent methyltransferase